MTDCRCFAAHFSLKILSLALLPVHTCAKHSWLFPVASVSANCSWKADWKVFFFSFRFSRIPGQVFPILPLVAVSAIFPTLPFWKEPGLGWKIRALKQERSDSSVLTRMSRRLRHFASHFHSCDPRRILHRAFAREATAFLSDFSIFKFKWSWSDEWFPCELPGSIFRA